MKIYMFLKENSRIVKYAIIGFLPIPLIVQMFFSRIPLNESLTLPVYSLILLVFGYWGIRFVLGIQFRTRLASHKILSLACDFFFFFGLFILIFILPMSVFPARILDDALSRISVYPVLGMVVAAYKLKDKHFISNKE